ncbi:hypothetical protein D3C78_1262790 [compost metagenome]
MTCASGLSALTMKPLSCSTGMRSRRSAWSLVSGVWCSRVRCTWPRRWRIGSEALTALFCAISRAPRNGGSRVSLPLFFTPVERTLRPL